MVNVAERKRELGHALIPDELERLDIIPSSFGLLRHGEIKGGSGEWFLAILKILRPNYDLILVESAPSSRGIHKSIMSAAGEMLVPFIPDTLSFQGTVGFLDAIQPPLKAVGQTKSVVTGLLPVMVRSRTLVHSGGMEVMRSYADGMNLKVTTSFIPYSVINATSMAAKMLPAVMVFPRSPEAAAYVEAARELGII